MTRTTEMIRTPLRRYYGRGDLHFITFSCDRRRALLATPSARNRFVKILDELRSRHGFKLFGYVVMPEHVHLLISEPDNGTPSSVMQVLKQKVSRELGGNDDRGFWQRRFYDFNVWSTKKVLEKLEYMHENPVKRGLVSHESEWAWSSWSHYAKRKEGIITIDLLEETRETSEHAEKKPHP